MISASVVILLTALPEAIAYVYMLYRRPRESVDGRWHFNRECPFWPRHNYVGIAAARQVNGHKLLCPTCGKLESARFRRP
jgi:hypothetical protein